MPSSSSAAAPSSCPSSRGLVTEHPLNERLRGQLMVALYRAGRQPEALEAFRVGRAALVEAFGIEPTPALKELESRVLLQDPALDAPEPSRGSRRAREERRTVLLAAREGAQLDGLVAVGRCLAALGRHELLLTQAVESEASLAGAVAATRARRDELATAGVTARAAAFVSRAFGPDMARLALTHDADLTVVGSSRRDRSRRIHPGGPGAPARAVAVRRRTARRSGTPALRRRHRRRVRGWRARLGGRGARSVARRRRVRAAPARRRPGPRRKRREQAARLGLHRDPAGRGRRRRAGARRCRDLTALVAAAGVGRRGRRGALAALAARRPRRVAPRAPGSRPRRRSSCTAERAPAASRRASS